MSDTVVFHSPGELDVRAITTFGLHAKPNTDSPIGHFGTGLKYALAVLARLDQRVQIRTCGKHYDLTVEKDEFRGIEFGQLHLTGSDGEELALPFTTALGKHWEPWMAYRELYCNALDEGGGVSTDRTLEDCTTITVTGTEIAKVHANRSRYFIQPSERVVEDLEDVAIVKQSGVYRRGIRVSDTIYYPTVMGYDIRGGEIQLTEDRTLKFASDAENIIKVALAERGSRATVRQVLAAPDGTFERCISWYSHLSYSDTFKSVLSEMSRTCPQRLSPSARQLSYDIFPIATRSPPVDLRPPEALALARARDFLKRRGVDVDAYPIVVVETLGEGIMGLAKDDTVYLSRAVFEPGTKYVASTLFEEITHLQRGYADCTRELQNYLLNTLFGAWEELDGSIL